MISMLDKHVATCQFTLLPCPKDCKNDDSEIKHFMKKDVDDHLENDCPNRDYYCAYCGFHRTYAYITEVHDQECKEKIIPCPNYECQESGKRAYIDVHVDECNYTVIPCEYKFIGCDEMMMRKDMQQHEKDDTAHLHMAIKTTLELKKEVALKKQLFFANEGINFKLAGFQKAKKKNHFFSPSFYTHPGGYHMMIEVLADRYAEFEGTHISVYAFIEEGEYDEDLDWPFFGEITFTLLNQLDDKNHYTGVQPNLVCSDSLLFSSQ